MNFPIRATVETEPRLTIPVIRCDNSVVPQTASALAKLSLHQLAANVVVPVRRRMHKSALLQETDPDWDRQLDADRDLGPPHFSAPLVLSSRNRWHIKGNVSEIFDRAVVIDGARRLEAAFAFLPTVDVPVIIVFGLTADAELALRHRLKDKHASPRRIDVRERIGTTAPRLSVDEHWIDVELCSDPFVTPTSLGYSPAILVRRPAVHHAEHLLIGAKSISKELELLRKRHGTLLGMHVSIRKQDPTRRAPYVLRVNEHPGE